MSKKILCLAIAVFASLFNVHAHAKTGDVIGHIYSTDISAFINNRPVESYSIGGKTVKFRLDTAGIISLT